MGKAPLLMKSISLIEPKAGTAADRHDYYWENVRKYGREYKDFEWSSVEVLLNMLYTYDVLTKHFSSMMRAHGLTLPSFNVLMILSRSGKEGCQQGEISKLLLVSRANVTGLLDHLMKRGLVTRVEDKNDRRVWIAKITQKGEALLCAYLPEHYAEIKQRLSVFGAAEKKA